MRAYEHSKRRSIEPYRRKKKVDYDYGIVIHLHAIGSNVTQIDYETTEEIDALHHLPDELGPHYTAPALPDERGAAGEQFLQYAARRGVL